MKRRQMAETLLSALFFFSAWSGLSVVHTAFANEADEEVLYLADVRFENLDSDFLNEKKARKTVRLTPGQRLSPEIGNQAAWRLMEAYRIRYHYQPVVRWSAVSADRAGFADLVFSVEAGPRGKVATVYFSGNKALRSSVLRAGLGVLPQTGFWARTLGRDVFRIETLEQDRKTILRTYQEQGFTRAEVGAPVIHPAGPGRLRIEWPIRMEGPQFRVGKLDIQSDIPFPRARGLSALSLRLGARFDILRMEESAASLTGLLRENGYPFAEVKAQAELDDARGLAYIVWAIQAGQPATVRSVLIRGNTRTSDLVLRREIELKAGDCYRESAAAASRANLLALGLFEEVRVAAVGQKEAAACEIEVDVKERPTGTVQIGLQYDSEERGAIVLELRERNFSFRPPYRGDGIDLFFSSQWGETRSRVSLNGTLPRLGYSPYLLNSGIHFDDAEYEENYSQRSYGLTVRTGRAVGRHDRISLGYQLTQFEVYGVDSRASALTRQEEGEIRLGSLVSRWTHDQRNRSFRPTQGWLSSLEPFWGSSALGGDVDVWGVEARASVYYSPWAEHVLNVRGTFRSVDSLDSADRAPLALRHFLGGSADLRGFEYRTVSPRDAEGNRTGGQTAWWTALEYTVPVFSRLDLSAYYEMGDVGAESFRFQGEGPVSDWGLGLTVRADNFPIRIDVAFPVATVEGDPDNKPGQPRFSFSVGYGL